MIVGDGCRCEQWRSQGFQSGGIKGRGGRGISSPAGGSGLCKERISDQVLHDVKISVSGTPTKIRRGVPVWFRGKLSPAFDNHWFCPSPPKKKGKPAVSYDKELFPASAFTSC
jgi:hypothetical protein